MAKRKTPKVFLSYSWDDEDHKKWVKDLAVRLRSDGVNVILDCWQKAGEQLPEFMEKSVRESDFVLVICTPKYKKKSDKRKGGVGYEGDIMTAEVFVDGNDQKFIPILRKDEWKKSAASWLKGKQYLDFRKDSIDEETYRELLQILFGVKEIPPPIGKRFELGMPILSKELRQAREKYLKYIIDTNQYIDPRGIMQTRRSVALKLDEVYVSMKVECEARDLKEIQEWLGGLGMDSDGASEVIDWLGDISGENRQVTSSSSANILRTETVDLAKAVRENPRMIILGEPGAGKTTLLRFLALHYAQTCTLGNLPIGVDVNDKDGNSYGAPRIPIYIRVANYADAFSQKRNLSLREFILDSFGEVDVLNESTKQFLGQTLRDGQAIVLFDGLDEITDTGDRSEIGRRIEQFISGGNNMNLFIITSRIAGYRETPLAGDFVVMTLRELERPEIEKFLHKWCPAAEKAQTPDLSKVQIEKRAIEEIDEIIKAVDENPGVRRLAANPLMLTILALIHRAGARLPSRRIELYELAVKTLLEDWELARGIPEKKIVKESEALRLLGPLAYWMHENKPQGLASESEIKEQLAIALSVSRNLMVDSEEIEFAVEDFLHRVREHTGIFVERAPKQYGFMHLTFEEYFSARAMTRRRNEVAKKIYDHRHNPRWEEPILLAIAFISNNFSDDAMDVIQTALLAEGERSTVEGFSVSACENVLNRDLLLATKAIGDCIGLNTSFIHHMIHRLIAVYLDKEVGGRYKLLQRHILAVMHSLRGNDAIEGAVIPLIKALDNPDKEIRLLAISALIQLGIEKKEIIIKLVGELNDQDKFMRDRVVEVFTKFELSTPIIIQELLLSLKKCDDDTRISIIAVLGKIRNINKTMMTTELQALLKDKNFDVRMEAVRVLGSLGFVETNTLRDVLVMLESLDDHKRSQAANVLLDLRTKSHEVLKVIFKASTNKNTKVREDAIKLLGKLKVTSSEVVDILIGTMVVDNSAKVRATAAESLGRLGLGTEYIANKLIATLRDEDASVRQSASEALKRLGTKTPKLVAGLFVVLDDKNIRPWAAMTLANLGVGVTDVLEYLLAVLDKKEKGNRWLAVYYLGKLGVNKPEVTDSLCKALDDDTVEVRAHAFYALGELGHLNSEIVMKLLKGLTDKDAIVQEFSIVSLVRLRCDTEFFLDRLQVMLQDQDNEVCAYAAWATGNLATWYILSDEQLDMFIRSLYTAIDKSNNHENVIVLQDEIKVQSVFDFIWDALWQLTLPLSRAV